jgi:hypothetical protein
MRAEIASVKEGARASEISCESGIVSWHRRKNTKKEHTKVLSSSLPVLGHGGDMCDEDAATAAQGWRQPPQ